MSTRKPPLLLRGGLTGRVYVVTSYTDHGNGRYTVHTKHDVTEQYNALRAEDEWVPGDPVYREDVNVHTCPSCGTSWTADVDACPSDSCAQAGERDV